VGFEAAHISNDHGQLIAAQLATYLFRRPIERLA
jgi:hypothetical protein